MNKIYVGIICFLAILLLLSQWQGCTTKNDLQAAIDGRAKVDSDFVKQGKELKDVLTAYGDTVKEAISLRLNEAQLDLLVQDLRSTIKHRQPMAVTVSGLQVRIDTVKTIFHDSLPCQPFDTTFQVTDKWFKYAIQLTNKSHTLSDLEVPFKITQVFNERSRFLRQPITTVDTRIDNPFVKLQSVSSAVRKEKSGFKVVNIFIPVGLGVLVGMYLAK